MRNMKMFYLPMICVISMIFYGCSKEEKDMFGVSSTEVKFEKQGGTKDIQIDNKSWWINDVMFNGFSLKNDPSVKCYDDQYGCTIKVESDSFLFQKTQQGIQIKVSSIEEESRNFDIILQDDDFFEHIYIYQ
jgi:hypothetical protein